MTPRRVALRSRYLARVVAGEPRRRDGRLAGDLAPSIGADRARLRGRDRGGALLRLGRQHRGPGRRRARQTVFAPRKPRSPWAASNKARVERLISEGRMEPAGLAAIERAKSNGSWEVPTAASAWKCPWMSRSPQARPSAASNFAAFRPSARKSLLGWVALAVKPETRASRIAEIAEQRSGIGARGLTWRRPDLAYSPSDRRRPQTRPHKINDCPVAPGRDRGPRDKVVASRSPCCIARSPRTLRRVVPSTVRSAWSQRS